MLTREIKGNLKPMSSDEWIQYFSENEFTGAELAWFFCIVVYWRSLLTDPEHLFEITKGMLDLGMNPNQIVSVDEDEDPIPGETPENGFYHIPLIDVTRFDSNEVVEKNIRCAASMKLLLEHGGDPNTVHLFEEPGDNGEDYNENVTDFYYWGIFAHGPDLDECDFYGFLLCYAYGGKYHNGCPAFDMLIDAPPSIFKDYERYWFEWEYQKPLYVIEKETGKRVAKWVF